MENFLNVLRDFQSRLIDVASKKDLEGFNAILVEMMEYRNNSANSFTALEAETLDRTLLVVLGQYHILYGMLRRIKDAEFRTQFGV